MRFSQRKGLVPVRMELQREEMDHALRTKIWAMIYHSLKHFEERNEPWEPVAWTLVEHLWVNFFIKPIDESPGAIFPKFAALVRDWCFSASWHQVYDFIEVLYAAIPDELQSLQEAFPTLINLVLEQEMSAYRLIDGQITSITSEEEIQSVNDALAVAEQHSPVHAHLRAAVAKLSERKSPDYRNSMKESISAVEAMCRILISDSKATLGSALKRLEGAGIKLHPSLKGAWEKLYGYTSDGDGIRHAISDDSSIGFDEAKLMLVQCTAFINYLIARMPSVAGSNGANE